MVKTNNFRTLVIINSLGIFIEWFEYTVFSFSLHKVSSTFFAENTSPEVVWWLFAVSYLFRPVGAFIFGYIGDYLGRQKALYLSLMCMGIATAGIGLLPSYESIGSIATLGAVLFRILQGIAVSGEFPGVLIYLLEKTDQNNKNLICSFLYTAGSLGTLAGLCSVSVLSSPFFPVWAWRIPFLLGSFSTLIAMGLRQISGAHIQPSQEKDLVRSIRLRDYWQPVLQTFLVSLFLSVTFCFCNVWWMSYVVNMGYFTRHTSQLLSIFGIVMLSLFAIPSGRMADLIGTKKVLTFGLCLSMVTIPLQFYFSVQKAGLLAMLCYALSKVFIASIAIKEIIENFHPSIRYRSISVAWSIGSVVGAISPAIIESMHSSQSLMLFINALMAISFLTLVLTTRITNKHYL